MITGTLTVTRGKDEYKCPIIGVQNPATIRLDFDVTKAPSLFQDLNIPDYFQAFVSGGDYVNNSGEIVKQFPIEITKRSTSIRLYKNREHIWHYVGWMVKHALYCAEQRDFLEGSVKFGDIFSVQEEEVAEKKTGRGVLFTNIDMRFVIQKGNLRSLEAEFTIESVDFILNFVDDSDFVCELNKVFKYEKTVQVRDPFNTVITQNQFESLIKMGAKAESLLVDLDTLLVRKRMEDIFNYDSRYIETTEQFFDFLNVLEEHKKSNPRQRFGLDYETTGLRMCSKSRDRHPKSDRPVGMVMGFEGEDTVYYISLYHTSLGNCLTKGYEQHIDQITNAINALPVDDVYKQRVLENIPEHNDWVAMALLKPYLEFFPMVNANISFDWRCGWIYGVNINYVGDTQIAGHLNRYKFGSNPGLKALTKLVLNKQSIELDDFSPTGDWDDLPLSFRDLPRRYITAYAFNDIRNLFPILQETERLVDRTEQRFIYDLEVLVQKCIGYQEFWGYDMDLESVEQTEQSVESVMKESSNKMFALVGEEFNPDSPQQLLHMLNKMGHPVKSTNKESLALLPSDDPFIEALKAYKGASQTKKLFLKPLPSQLIDRTVYPSTLGMGADTGRMTASRPNYQQADDIIRQLIVPREGFKFLDTDLAQIEYRVNASVAGEESLTKMFENPWNDFHTYQTSIIYDVPYESVPKDLRNRTKAVNFGLIFGMGAGLMGYHVFGKRTTENTKKASEIKAKIFASQRNVERFFARTIQYAQGHGYTKTLYNRRRFFDIARNGKDSVVTVASNAVIQGTACDIFKLGCVTYFLKLTELGLLDKVRFIAFVHDELLDEFSTDLNPYFMLKLKRECFEQTFRGMCPVYSGCGIGDTWSQAKSDDAEMNTVLGRQLYHKADTVYWKDSKYYCDKDFTKLMQEELHSFRIQVIKEYITNKENDNKVIAPHVYSYINAYFSPKVCEHGVKTKGCLKARVIECPNGTDLSECPLHWSLNKHIEHFIENYAPELRGEELAKILDPADVKQDKEEKKEGSEITDSVSFSATADDYLMVTGYYLDGNKLHINLATLSEYYTRGLAEYLDKNAAYYEDGDISIPEDNRLFVTLVYVNKDVAKELTGYILPDKCELDLIRFVMDACQPLTV